MLTGNSNNPNVHIYAAQRKGVEDQRLGFLARAMRRDGCISGYYWDKTSAKLTVSTGKSKKRGAQNGNTLP